MSERGITSKQAEIMKYILDYAKEWEITPSREEIRKRFGFKSPNTITGYIRALVKKGYITIIPGMARGIRIRRPDE